MATSGSGEVSAGVHVFLVRVYYEDTDAGGVVYYAHYLKFAERARTELLRLAGADHGGLKADDGLAIAVKRCEVDFLLPAYLDDTLDVHTRILEIEGASLWAEQIVKRDNAELAKLRVRRACVNASGHAARLPGPLRDALGSVSQPQGRD